MKPCWWTGAGAFLVFFILLPISCLSVPIGHQDGPGPNSDLGLPTDVEWDDYMIFPSSSSSPSRSLSPETSHQPGPPSDQRSTNPSDPPRSRDRSSSGSSRSWLDVESWIKQNEWPVSLSGGDPSTAPALNVNSRASSPAALPNNSPSIPGTLPKISPLRSPPDSKREDNPFQPILLPEPQMNLRSRVRPSSSQVATKSSSGSGSETISDESGIDPDYAVRPPSSLESEFEGSSGAISETISDELGSDFAPDRKGSCSSIHDTFHAATPSAVFPEDKPQGPDYLCDKCDRKFVSPRHFNKNHQQDCKKRVDDYNTYAEKQRLPRVTWLRHDQSPYSKRVSDPPQEPAQQRNHETTRASPVSLECILCHQKKRPESFMPHKRSCSRRARNIVERLGITSKRLAQALFDSSEHPLLDSLCWFACKERGTPGKPLQLVHLLTHEQPPKKPAGAKALRCNTKKAMKWVKACLAELEKKYGPVDGWEEDETALEWIDGVTSEKPMDKQQEKPLGRKKRRQESESPVAGGSRQRLKQSN